MTWCCLPTGQFKKYILHVMMMKNSSYWWYFLDLLQISSNSDTHPLAEENQSSKEKSKIQGVPASIGARTIFKHIFVEKKQKRSKQLSHTFIFQEPPLTLKGRTTCKRNDRWKKKMWNGTGREIKREQDKGVEDNEQSQDYTNQK